MDYVSSRINLTISFTIPASEGGSAITGYKVLSGGAQVASGTTNSIPVAGLAAGTAHSFTVKAINSVGESAASTAVNVTPAAVPGVPTNVTATVENTRSTISFNAPTSDGGSAITGYKVFSGVTLVPAVRRSYRNITTAPIQKDF